MSERSSFAVTAALLAFTSIRRRPVRAGLTAFGILVGVAAVTLVVALADAAKRVVGANIDALGTNALIVFPRAAAKSGVRDADVPAELTQDDAEALRTQAPAVSAVAPLFTWPEQIVSDRSNAATGVVGSNLDFFSVRAWKPTRGAIWSRAQDTDGARVCLLGTTVQEQLFGPEDPIGRTVRIGRFPFKVIGLLAKKGENPFGGDQDDVVVMPLTTLKSKLVRPRPGQVHSILFSAKDPDSVDHAQRQAVEILRQRHHLLDGAPDDFEVHTQDEFRKAQTDILGVLEVLLLGIAAVSLGVGGIGVMNIMLVSVAERTREIGIRLAVGARQADILAQFLVEAVVLTGLGGLSGALAAAIGVVVLGKVLELPMRISGAALVIALATSTVIGLVFGLFPARRAARLDPVVALTTE